MKGTCYYEERGVVAGKGRVQGRAQDFKGAGGNLPNLSRLILAGDILYTRIKHFTKEGVVVGSLK